MYLLVVLQHDKARSERDRVTITKQADFVLVAAITACNYYRSPSFITQRTNFFYGSHMQRGC